MSPPDTILAKLLTLIGDLYEDTEEFLERSDDAQLWYDRGYANGMIEALRALGHGAEIERLVEPDDPAVIAEQRLLPWGKAYTHGYEKGWRETHDVMGGS